MNIYLVIAIQLLFLLVPFIILYAVSLAKKKKYTAHRKIQNILYVISVFAVVVLEINIRISGGSGSLVGKSEYVGTPFFKWIFVTHIVWATLTIVVWTILVALSNKRFNTRLPGNFSRNHKKIGYMVFVGLVINAILSLLVSLMAFVL